MKYITTRHEIGEPFEAPTSIAGIEIKCAPIYEHILLDNKVLDKSVSNTADCWTHYETDSELIVVWRILEK